MKKPLAASITAALFLVSPSSMIHAQEIQPSLPDLTNKNIVSQLKAGTYSYKGITTKSTHADVHVKLGKGANEILIRSTYSAVFSDSFGKNYHVNID